MTAPALRALDLWAAGKWLTCDDNMAHVPSLTWYMRKDADRVRRRHVRPCPVPGRSPEEVFRLLQADRAEFREKFWFMRWSETVDNVSTYAYLDGDLVIAFGFWRPTHPFPEDLGEVFVARVSPDEFVTLVEEAADLLDAGLESFPDTR